MSKGIRCQALGENLEDPPLLFSVLFGISVTNFAAVKGEVQRELGAQFLALAEKQGATVPLMIGHRIMGTSLMLTGRSRKVARMTIRRSRFTIPPSIVRWRRDLATTIG